MADQTVARAITTDRPMATSGRFVIAPAAAGGR